MFSRHLIESDTKICVQDQSLFVHTMFHIFLSYLSKRTFQVKHGYQDRLLLLLSRSITEIIGPELYNIITRNMPHLPDLTVVTLPDDAAFHSCSEDLDKAIADYK